MRRLKIGHIGLSLLFCLGLYLVGPVGSALADEIEIPSGLRVTLAMDETVSTATAKIGQTVSYTVSSPVTVDGKVVFEEGAVGLGKVSRSVKRELIGRPGILRVDVRTVTAVDGTPIPVSGTQLIEGKDSQVESIVLGILCCGSGLLIKGGDAEIAAGTPIDATVNLPVTTLDVPINVEVPEEVIAE